MIPAGILDGRAFSRPTKMKPCGTGYVVVPTHHHSSQYLEHLQSRQSNPHIIVKMANRGYDVVVDVDTEVCFILRVFRGN